MLCCVSLCSLFCSLLRSPLCDVLDWYVLCSVICPALIIVVICCVLFDVYVMVFYGWCYVFCDGMVFQFWYMLCSGLYYVFVICYVV